MHHGFPEFVAAAIAMVVMSVIAAVIWWKCGRDENDTP